MKLLILASLLTLKAPAFPQDPRPQQLSELEAVVVTEAGSFRFEFAPDNAPNHVEQFIARAKEGYYDGSAFHRVVPNGLIQGGDPLLKDPTTPRNLWGSGGLNLFAGEPSDMKHERGVVSTVRTFKPNSDGSQFFICVGALPALDHEFTAFGRITEGMDVVDKISRMPATENTLIQEPVRILRISIERKKPH